MTKLKLMGHHGQMKKFVYLLALTLSFSAYAANFDLTEKQLATINRGELVTKTEKVKGAVWPKVTIYSVIDAKPLEAVAIFYALDYQKNYTPNILKSDPIKYVSPTEIYTAYEIDLPWPVSNSKYISGAKLSKTKDGEFEVNFYQVESDSADDTRGSAKFTPYQNKTFYTYTTFVIPKSFLAGLLRKLMVRDTKKSIEALRLEISKLKAKKSPLMATYKMKIIEAFEGKHVYKLVGAQK